MNHVPPISVAGSQTQEKSKGLGTDVKLE